MSKFTAEQWDALMVTDKEIERAKERARDFNRNFKETGEDSTNKWCDGYNSRTNEIIRLQSEQTNLRISKFMDLNPDHIVTKEIMARGYSSSPSSNNIYLDDGTEWTPDGVRV